MKFIVEFELALENKKARSMLVFITSRDINVSESSLISLFGNDIPESVKGMLISLNGIEIEHPRHFRVLKLSELNILENRYLHFAFFNHTIKICLDMKVLNSAKEWDVVNYSDKYVITKTVSSFLTNKVWAWIDRSRVVWGEENPS